MHVVARTGWGKRRLCLLMQGTKKGWLHGSDGGRQGRGSNRYIYKSFSHTLFNNSYDNECRVRMYVGR